jgi:hypothetical protein
MADGASNGNLMRDAEAIAVCTEIRIDLVT